MTLHLRISTERTHQVVKAGGDRGKLIGIKALARKCNCPKYFKHEALIRKEKISKAAQYPEELCMECAKLLLKYIRTVLELEWWRHEQKRKVATLNEVEERWASSKEKKIVAKPVEDKVMKELRGCKRAWDQQDIEHDLFPKSGQPSKRRRRGGESHVFWGHA